MTPTSRIEKLLEILGEAGDKPSSGPDWIRLPKPGKRCPISGLSRTTLNELCLANRTNDFRPQVKSVVIKKRGAIRGIRLISAVSLRGYLARLADEVGPDEKR